ncbi:sensor histidine kinase [Streptomyces solincola]|uniref:Sensor histidine kinase n=1 Tax=Streptomyces solincola TaxID=2100817 RepID=A0A2S9PSA0_9ACTN|nr:anti-sigma factor RsbA family regulatory protein [Streptomyces solincola]PRH77296.1 sensor histidine kinase [Streptomyces solincola]
MTTSLLTDRVLPPGESFAHPALSYRDEPDFLRTVGAFVRDGLEAGRPVLVLVPRPRLEALRDRFGGDDGVVWTDMAEAGRNPGRVLSLLAGFTARHAGRPVRIVMEPIWPGRHRAETGEAARLEALVNVAFADRPASFLCAYQEPALPREVVALVRRAHPSLLDADAGRVRESAEYTDPLAVCAQCATPLEEPAEPVPALAYADGDLAAVRAFVSERLAGTALAPSRRTDLVLAVTEAATNSLRHGGGRGALRLWTTRGEGAGRVHVETRDAGRLDDPLAGCFRPDPAAASGGRGLWMINELCDLVRIRSSADGLVLRMSMDLR